MNNQEIKIGKCQWWFHEEKYGKKPVELFGYCWFNNQVIDTEKHTVKPTGEREKLEYCQKCYDYLFPIMIKKHYKHLERNKLDFYPHKWFYFYQDENKNQAIENGKQLDYYYQQKAPYHKEVILLNKDRAIDPWIKKEYLDESKGIIIDLYIGNFGVRYCIFCSTKRNDETDKRLVMSLNNCKMCFECSIARARSLIDGSNPDLIIKERIRKSENGFNTQIWNNLDKEAFASELEQELRINYHQRENYETRN